ncbi:hypothetical protein CMT41_02215 [Colwellia sp. MT41]|uniref:oligosaccharide flippase family protein n=1 Tax=Colwellia sp. MT41 TaxID=58049 RepID=UPI0007177CAB|nr:oligosaccharide flippase family protein [Colwellia sp. MT41]ALO33657.1 hypothetical protein CMT41_02215 [Colwellia sp. MT41]
MFDTLSASYRKKDTKILISNFFSLIVLKGFDFIIPLITFPYIVSVIGLDKFGLINFSLAFSVYFSAIIQYGFNVTSTRDIARNRDNKDKLASIYSVTLTTSLLLVFICFAFYALIVLSFDKFSQYQLLYWFTFLSVALKSLFPIWLFQGLERMKYITYLSLIGKILFLVFLFLVIKEENDYIYIPLLHSITAFLTLIAAILIISREFKITFKLASLAAVIKQLKYGYNAFICQFAPNLYANTAIFALGLFTNNSTVGIFSAASKVIDVVGSFAYILSSTFFPYISRNIGKHNVFKFIMLFTSVMLMLLLIGTADLIVSFLFKNVNENVAFYIRILSPVIPLIFMQLTFGTNYLMLIGKEQTVKNITLSVSVISLVYSIPMIFFYGIYGTIFTLIFTRIIMVSLYYHYYSRSTKEMNNEIN